MADNNKDGEFKIIQERDSCIGCGACAAVCDNWKIADDGKASPVKTDITKAEVPKNQEAANSCPVNIIHIEDKKTGKRLV